MEKEQMRRRHLPHWDMPGAPYFVTTCLAGSIPAQGLLDISRYQDELQKRPMLAGSTDHEWRLRLWKLAFARVEHWLDVQPSNRALENTGLAKIVEDSFFHFAGQRYDLYAYVVMPSHFHWLFQPLPAWIQELPDNERSPRERINYSLKRFTANRCNQFLHTNGTFWQRESYDHWVRDADEMDRIIRYIEENPVKARLVQSPEEWIFSSTRARKDAGTEWGLPLPRRPLRSGSVG